MPRRIDIELTSALADDSWTWRAAGAKKPNGVVAGNITEAEVNRAKAQIKVGLPADAYPTQELIERLKAGR